MRLRMVGVLAVLGSWVFACRGVLGGNSDTLYVATLLPMTGPWPGGRAMLTAATMALDHINNRTDILPHYKLHIVHGDTKFDVYEGVHVLQKLMTSAPPKVMTLGAANSELTQASALLSELSGIVQVSYASVSPTISDKSTYPFLFRTSAPDTAVNPARIEMMAAFGWRKAATIRQARAVFDAVTEDLEKRFQEANITLLTSEVFQNDPTPQIINLKKHDARIIFLVANRNHCVRVMCEAYRIGLTGPKYVWNVPGWFDDGWWKGVAVHGCTAAEMDLAVEGHMLPGDVTLDPTNARSIAGITASEFAALYQEKTNYTSPFGTNLVAQIYDAVWAMALALDAAERELIQSGSGERLSDFTYSSPSMSALIHRALKNVSFQGVKSFIRFDDNQDPIITVRIVRLQRAMRHIVALYHPDPVNGSHIEWSTVTPLNWQGGKAPVDSNIILIEKLLVPVTVYAAICAVSGVGMMLALVFLTINTMFRHKRVIKMSSPTINNIILVGCLIMYTTVFVEKVSPEQLAIVPFCVTKAFLLVIGFSLAFGALFSKTWRIYVIFANKHVQKKVVKDSQLIAVVVALLGLNVGVLVVWTGVDPFYVTTYNDTLRPTEENEDILVQEQRDACESMFRTYFLGAILLIQGLLLMFGAFLAWQTRKVNIPALNDSRHIGLCIYNVFVLSIVTVILSFTTEEEVAINYLITSSFTLVGTTLTLCMLFIPKISKLVEGRVSPEADDNFTKSSLQTQQTQDTSAEDDTVVGDLTKKLEEVQKRLAQKEAEIAALKSPARDH